MPPSTTLPLDAVGHVPWWPADRNEVTLHRILVHVATETSRHAGHADIVRELIDGAAGLTPGRPNLPSGDQAQLAVPLRPGGTRRPPSCPARSRPPP